MSLCSRGSGLLDRIDNSSATVCNFGIELRQLQEMVYSVSCVYDSALRKQRQYGFYNVVRIPLPQANAVRWYPSLFRFLLSLPEADAASFSA